MKKIVSILSTIFLLSAILSSCTDLEENPYSSIPSDEFFNNEEEFLMSAGRIYAYLVRYTCYRCIWGTISVSTDEAVSPLREGNQWVDDGVWRDMHAHTWNSQMQDLQTIWEFLFGGISLCNQILYEFDQSSVDFEAKPSLVAEVLVMRAWFYLNAMDLFGNVPFTTDFSDTSLPRQVDRKFLFSFIEQQIKDNVGLLQDVPTASNYGRVTKAMAYTTLAKLYINAQEWIGEAKWDETIAACDQVIGFGQLEIEPDYFSNFKVDNTSSKENIFVILYDKVYTSQNWWHVFRFHQLTLNSLSQQTYGILDFCWNGFAATESFYNTKSKGNVVDPYVLAEMFGVDALRFFLLRTFPFGSDGNFSNELLISTINTDLANKLGNLVSRTTGMVEKYFGGKLPAAREDAPEDCDLKKTVCALRSRYEAEMDKLQLQNGLDEIFKVIDRANKYIDETAPWTLGKDESKHVRLATVLYNLLETIRVCTTLLMPVMPDTCEKIFAKIGAGAAARTWDNSNVWGVLPTEAQVSKGENLFPRVDAEATLEKLNAMQEAQKKAALPAVEVEPFVQEEVDFDTFLKSDFRAVKIKNCEAVKKSDKLLKFTLDDGSGTDRIILSGIHQYYEPEQLIGKTAIAILNLPPRKMMGIPSCGMLISAVHQEHGEEKLHLMLIDDSVPAGAKLC